MYSLTYIFFCFILFNEFYVCVDFCWKLIFINNLIKQVNDLYCDIKYLDLHPPPNFSSFFLLLLTNFVFIFLHK